MRANREYYIPTFIQPCVTSFEARLSETDLFHHYNALWHDLYPSVSEKITSKALYTQKHGNPTYSRTRDYRRCRTGTQ